LFPSTRPTLDYDYHCHPSSPPPPPPLPSPQKPIQTLNRSDIPLRRVYYNYTIYCGHVGGAWRTGPAERRRRIGAEIADSARGQYIIIFEVRCAAVTIINLRMLDARADRSTRPRQMRAAARRTRKGGRILLCLCTSCTNASVRLERHHAGSGSKFPISRAPDRAYLCVPIYIIVVGMGEGAICYKRSLH